MIFGIYAQFVSHQRKQAEEMIRKAYLELDQIFNTAADGMSLIDTDFNIIKINDTFSTLLGINKDEAKGKKCYELFGSQECLTARCYLTRILNGEKGCEGDTEKKLKDGSFIYCIVSASPFWGLDNKLLGIVEDIKDITKRKQIDEELKNHRFRLEEIVKERTAELSLMNTQMQQEIIERKQAVKAFSREAELNEAMAELSKALISVATIDEIANLILTNAQFLTKSEFGYVGYIDPETNFFNCVAMTQEIYDNCRVKDKDKYFVFKEFTGLWGWGLNNRKPLLTNNLTNDPRSHGTPSGHVPISHYLSAPAMIKETLVGQIGVANKVLEYTKHDLIVIERLADIYAIAINRQRTEEAKKKMQAQLSSIQKLEAVGTLAGGIAHDFNNLLTAVIGNLSLLKQDLKAGDKGLGIIKEMQTASQQAKGLTQQLLTFSKGGAPIKKVTSIAELFKKTVPFALSGSKVISELSLPDDLWYTEIDEDQMNQVINNIIINADQAMPQGGTVKISAKNVIIKAEEGLPIKEGKYIKIAIKDQGIGVPQDILPRIFDPFFSTKSKGSGLGLSISHSIVIKHEGYITAKSQEGSGTTFFIYLPASVQEAFAVKKIEGKILSGQGKILFMDDQKNIRSMVKQMLNSLGYEVELAEDGIKAIELYEKAQKRNRPFDVVVLDLTVPGGMGGVDAIGKLIELDPEVKAIVSSGYANDRIMGGYKEYGFRGVMAKPFDIEELSSVLNQVLQEKGNRVKSF